MESQSPTSAAVWSTTGRAAIDTRAVEFVEAATDEVILIVNDGETTSDRVLDRLHAASERGVAVLVGTLTESAADRVRTAVPDVQFIESELSWLQAPEDHAEEAVLGRIVVCDRSAVLLSSLNGSGAGAEGNPNPGDQQREHALWCDDVGNGLVLIVRRLLLAEIGATEATS